MNNPVGKCGYCGGIVSVPDVWMGTGRPLAIYESCGSEADLAATLPTLLMKPKLTDCKLKSGIPHNAACFFQDGNQWCCVFGNFINLQESPAGFGKDFTEAHESLKSQIKG